MSRWLRRVITRRLLDVYCNTWSYTIAMVALNVLAAIIFGLVSALAKESICATYAELVSIAFSLAAASGILIKSTVHKVWPWWMKMWYNEVRPSIRDYVNSPGDL